VGAIVAVVVLAMPGDVFALAPKLDAELRSSPQTLGAVSHNGRFLCRGPRFHRKTSPSRDKFTGTQLRPEHVLALTAAAAAASLLDPRTWLSPSQSYPIQDFSERQWTRQFRILGLDENAPKDKVLKAADALRAKYADDQEALERVDQATLFIMTRFMTESERKTLERQRAQQVTEVLETPKRLFNKYIASWIPVSVRSMLEVPNLNMFRRASGLLGVFALLGLCVPTQAQSFVGLGGAATLGLIYARNRPPPVKDSQGNVGKVEKLNMKEMGATVAIVLTNFALGAGITTLLMNIVAAEFQVVFCVSTCFLLWLAALFFKVYEVFD